jgi:hypothetical protein
MSMSRARMCGTTRQRLHVQPDTVASAVPVATLRVQISLSVIPTSLASLVVAFTSFPAYLGIISPAEAGILHTLGQCTRACLPMAG